MDSMRRMPHDGATIDACARQFVSKTQRFEINGRRYDSLDAMPKDDRALYDLLFGDRDGNGSPDVMDTLQAGGAEADALFASLKGLAGAGAKVSISTSTRTTNVGGNVGNPAPFDALSATDAAAIASPASAVRAPDTVVAGDARGSLRTIVIVALLLLAALALWWFVLR